MRVHFTGVCGTGMGQLALLFREAGHTVDGSDRAFDPPIGPQLREAGLSLKEGYEASHLTEGAGEPDLVVIGNAIRADNPEAVAARARACGDEHVGGAPYELPRRPTGRRDHRYPWEDNNVVPRCLRP